MSYKIPLFKLNYNKKEEEAVIKTLRSKWISMGPNVSNLEKTASRLWGINHAVAVTNCTSALHLALNVLGVKKGDEVIVPSLTFVATVNVVRYVGAKAVFADISSLIDFSIDPKEIERKITRKTKAIIVMHYGGFSCEMDKIMRIAKKFNLSVIEDAAHGPGAEYKGKKLGCIGHIGCFSFFSNKNITCSEGGMLVTKNEGYAKKAKLLRSHGMTTLSYARSKGHATDYDVQDIGFNYRLDDIRGALALTQLSKLERDIKKRRELRKIYISELKGIKKLIIPYINHPYKSSNYIFPILLKNSDAKKRDTIRQKLTSVGIQTSVHYPAVHRFFVYKRKKLCLPKSEYVADNEITLPLFYTLKTKEIKNIAKSLKEALKKS